MELWIHKEIGDASIPIYDTRLSLVKLLLELGMFEHAFTVLENLQKENDEVVDLWYLYGWTYYCLGDDEERTQEEKFALWADARDCLETAVKVYKLAKRKKGGCILFILITIFFFFFNSCII